MVEVLKDGVFGYSCTNRVTLKGIREAARGALAQARAAAELTVFKFDAGARPPEKGKHSSTYRLGGDALSPGEINELLIRACAAMKVSDKILDAKAVAAAVCTSVSDPEELHRRSLAARRTAASYTLEAWREFIQQRRRLY